MKQTASIASPATSVAVSIHRLYPGSTERCYRQTPMRRRTTGPANRTTAFGFTGARGFHLIEATPVVNPWKLVTDGDPPAPPHVRLT